MGELLRNSKEIITPYDGKPFQANNPEEYITRLHHFASGLGFTPEHLTSGKNPSFTSKHVEFNLGDGESKFDVGAETEYSFDEGMVPRGVSSAANDALYDRDDWSDGGYMAAREVRHRTGMDIYYQSHGRRGNNSDRLHHYGVTKGFNNNDPNHTRLERLEMPEEAWTSEGAQGAIKDVSSKFRDFNRNRVVDKSTVDRANEAIANPNPRTMDHIRRNWPSQLGSQFLGVATRIPREPRGPHTPGGLRSTTDYIDLHTGTWAKIDPDEYFPH